MSDTIESLLAEGRTFPPPPDVRRAARIVRDRAIYAEAEADPEAFWARQAGELLDWYEPWHTVLEWDLPVRQVVRGRQAQRRRTTASTATSTPVTATRSRTTGKASPATPAPSPTPTCSHDVSRARQRAEGARRRARATGSTSTSGWCRSCPIALLACARIGAAALGGVRRLLVGLAARPHPGRRGQGAHHRRRRVAARAASCRSRRRPTTRCPSARPSRRCWCCGAPARTSP